VRACVRLSCLSVCPHSHGRISWTIFAKSGTEVTTPKSKNVFFGSYHRTIPSPILYPKTAILGQKIMKIYANINMPISALNVRELPEFQRPAGNRGWGTRGDVWFQTGSRNKTASRIRIENKTCNMTFMAESPKFPRLTEITVPVIMDYAPQNLFLVLNVRLDPDPAEQLTTVPKNS